MSNLRVITRVMSQHRTCLVPRLGSSNHMQTCPASSPDTSRSLTLQCADSFWGYKRRPTPPQLIWTLHSLENTSNQPFLSSNSLSFKLHSNPSFLREIGAILWVTLSIFKQSTSPMISMCSLILGTRPLDGLGVSGSHQGCGKPRKICIALSFVGIW
jgi:hypothetical protein